MQIDVALQFYGNSSLSYSLPSGPATTLESVSMVIKPEQVTAGVLLSSRQGGNESIIILEIINGSLLFKCDPDSIMVGDGVIKEYMWYKIFATR